MQSSKPNVPSVFARLRAAFSSSQSPSDSDIAMVIEWMLPQVYSSYEANWTFAPVKFSDLFAINIKATNTGKQDEGKWLIRCEVTVTAKVNLNDLKDLTPEQRLTIALTYGGFTKGKVVEGPREVMFHMWKDPSTSSGWAVE